MKCFITTKGNLGNAEVPFESEGEMGSDKLRREALEAVRKHFHGAVLPEERTEEAETAYWRNYYGYRLDSYIHKA